MNLRCLGSGSSGNCYLLSTETETLILDCGLPIREIKKGLNWNISRVVAVLCSHSHLDHAKAVKDFENMGIPVVRFYEEPYRKYVKERKHILPEINGVKRVITYFYTIFITVGSFKVMGIQVPHDGAENYGFIIKVENQILFYFTDFECCIPVLKCFEPNHILVECNYQQGLVNQDLPNYVHKLKGHCSLETCKSFIAANKTNALRTVILCHMGDETTIAEECLSEVQKVAGEGVKCVCASAGETVELSLYPF